MRLGAGGMGQVYLGRDIGGRQAAVKVVRPGHAADPEFRNRFAREITTARSVNSPWTAAVVAADPHAPQPWLATEYVAGSDLAAAVAASGPSPRAPRRSSRAGSPRHWRTCTPPVWCTAISNRPTSC
ncbi:hypothetical protein FHX44_114317 [Pseudonocardia hierapolitana]|uniref:Protein kinase domain-containing protein n=1 Tax=Pseudonocardia hierapolitana TaxID=1128676 RepID=A0A561SU59_9PSEU|nr:hypothetical protein [Pseudonocardia hierapolitana]TWF78394.1 hypothetical protein FHX44_114317 [Pseudonocardia hierapolitana]